MEQGILKKDKLAEFLKGVQEGHVLYGPVSVEGVHQLRKLDSPEGMDLAYINLRTSLKDVLFPQDEQIASYDNNVVTEAGLPEEKCVVFGTRPCDARAFAILDKVFEGDKEDKYYLKRRENTVVISRACAEAKESCFCTSVGGGPADPAGSDVLVYDLGAELLFESASDKGTKFLDPFSRFFTPALDENTKQKDDLVAKAKDLMEGFDTSKVSDKMDKMFDGPVWEDISNPCIGCGACTFLCPTCHCFLFTDVGSAEKGKRVKCWDACQFPTFTLEASGHNPRATSRERLRQRFYHKFNYYVKNFQETACVGCGRCVDHCPVNIDVRELLKTIVKEG